MAIQYNKTKTFFLFSTSLLDCPCDYSRAIYGSISMTLCKKVREQKLGPSQRGVFYGFTMFLFFFFFSPRKVYHLQKEGVCAPIGMNMVHCQRRRGRQLLLAKVRMHLAGLVYLHIHFEVQIPIWATCYIPF